jgi:hypothetical protein
VSCELEGIILVTTRINLDPDFQKSDRMPNICSNSMVYQLYQVLRDLNVLAFADSITHHRDTLLPWRVIDIALLSTVPCRELLYDLRSTIVYSGTH